MNRPFKRLASRRWMIAPAVGAMAALLVTSPAAAHPLGNFSVNHHHRLSFSAAAIVDDAVIDRAEIPTAQAEADVDADGDGVATPEELRSHAVDQCAEFAGEVDLSVDGAQTPLAVTQSSFSYQDGQAGLSTSRLECRFEAGVDLSSARSVEFVDGFEPDRVGWREVVALGDGVRIIDSPVPVASTSDELRTYPSDLLSSPLDVRSVTLELVPGSSSAAPATVPGGAGSKGTAAGPFSGAVGGIGDRFDELIGQRDITLGVGLMAIALALILGASHALLPGHGKTLMAAYIAGRQGSARDAVVVGATVTATHTGGVLALGLALTLSTSLAGEQVLGWLGVASGLILTGLGVGLLVSNIRHRGTGRGLAHGHRHGYHLQHDHGHDHGHDDHHHHDHAHDDHSHDDHGHDHDHGHGHGHGGHRHGVGSVLVAPALLGISAHSPHSALLAADEPGSQFGRQRFTNAVELPVAARAAPPDRRVTRRGLIGMGIAGGLVPSPSALVILLSAIVLGRTWFGVLLVIGYGLGMAGTLAAAGLLLVVVRDRFRGRLRVSGARGRWLAGTWARSTPYLTAGLVLVVGAGLAIRSASLV